MSISLADVAKRAGVSTTAVSHVLNGNKSARIGLATQDRIRRAAEEMNYRPNSFARSIALQRTSTLRLISSSHDNPHFVHLTKAIDLNTRKAGYKLWVDATLNDRWTYAPGEDVGIWPVDGAIIAANSPQDLVYFLGQQANEIPVVYLGLQGPDALDTVTFDLYAGGRMAAEHVASRGYRRIAFLSPERSPEAPYVDLRIRAYEDVCRETGRAVEHIYLPYQRIELDCKLGLDAGLEIGARRAGERPDAVMCQNDMQAFGFIQGVRRAGLRVPEDIAVAGFDGDVEGQCLDFPLTTVSLPVDAMCKAVVELLVRRVAGDRDDAPLRLVFPTELIIGGTT